jgi:hypothetical protein
LVGIECVVYREQAVGVVCRIHPRMLSLPNGSEGFIVV